MFFNLYFFNRHNSIKGEQERREACRFFYFLEYILICLLNLKNYTENFLIFFQNRDVLEKEDNVFLKYFFFKFFETEEGIKNFDFLKLSLEHLKEIFLSIKKMCFERNFIEKNYGLLDFEKKIETRFFHKKINKEISNVNTIVFIFDLVLSQKPSVKKSAILFWLNFKKKWENLTCDWEEISSNKCLENAEFFLEARDIYGPQPRRYKTVLVCTVILFIIATLIKFAERWH